jgi:hypothetical protein
MFKTKHFGFFFFLILLSSCFEAVEEITYTTEKAGKYALTINCSQSRDKINAMMKLDTFMGRKIPKLYEIDSHMSVAAYKLKNTLGIHNVYYTFDEQQYIAIVKFDFDSTSALNRAIHNALETSSDKIKFPYIQVFSKKNTEFQRINTPGDSLIKITASYNLGVLNNAKVTCIYRFNQDVVSSSNTLSKIAQNKKAVMMQYKVTDLIKNTSLFKTSIILK